MSKGIERVAKILTVLIPIKKWRLKLREYIFVKIYILLNYKSYRNMLNEIEQCEKIISIITIKFDSTLYQRPQHLMSCLALKNKKILYFETASSCRIKSSDNLFILPHLVFKFLPKYILGKIYLFCLSTNYLLTYEKIIEYKAKGVKIIYDYIDEIDEKISGNTNELKLVFNNLEKIEPSLIISSAKRLNNQIIERFPKEKTLLIPNGVTLEDFRYCQTRVIPEDLKAILSKKKPIVGYYGAMAPWLDWQLINTMHRYRPEYEFVYLGVDYADSLKYLEARENVHFLGAKEYKDLILYSSHFNCATIPFGDKEIAESTSPLKLFEYMAAKIPTVCTKDLLECYGYEGVLISNDNNDFIINVDKAISMNNDKNIKNKLLEQVKDKTWANYANKIANKIEELL